MFEKVLGQNRAKRFLRQVIAREKIPHAYLFTGIPGIGKTTTAKALAMALNCGDPHGGDSCGRCTSCRQVMDGNSPDFLHIAPEPNSQFIKIDQVREGLQHALSFAPMGRYRVSLIQEAHKMTDEAANSFLKTLEEPPPHNVIILVTTEPKDLLPTIASRCQRVPFHPLSPDQIRAWLVEKGGVGLESAQVLSRICEGSLGNAITMWEQDFMEMRNQWLTRLVQLSGMGKEETLEMAMEVADGYGTGVSKGSSSKKPGIVSLLGVWASWYRDLLLYRTGSSGGLLMNPDFSQKLKNAAKDEKIEHLTKKLLLLDEAEKDLRRNRNTRLVMAHTLFGLHQFTR
jgi:DNA polymerase-3 subunit delta'